MKSELERVDFGGHPKYNGGSTFGNVLFPGRSEKFNIAKKAQTSSLFDLNPHRFGLGVNLEVGCQLLCCCSSQLARCMFFPALLPHVVWCFNCFLCCFAGLYSLKAVPQALAGRASFRCSSTTTAPSSSKYRGCVGKKCLA